MQFQFQCHSSVNRDIKQVSIEYQSGCSVSIKGIDQHSTPGAFNAHDPKS